MLNFDPRGEESSSKSPPFYRYDCAFHSPPIQPEGNKYVTLSTKAHMLHRSITARTIETPQSQKSSVTHGEI